MAATRYDILFVDVHLPDGSGLSLDGGAHWSLMTHSPGKLDIGAKLGRYSRSIPTPLSTQPKAIPRMLDASGFAIFRALRAIRPKCACRACEETVVQAKAPTHLTEDAHDHDGAARPYRRR